MSDQRVERVREAVSAIRDAVAFVPVDWDEVVDQAEVVHRIASDAARLGDEPVMWISGIHNGATIDIAAPASRATRNTGGEA